MLFKNSTVVILFLLTQIAMAQESQPLAKNIVYAQVGTVILTGMVGINYERVVAQNTTVRAAYLRGYRATQLHTPEKYDNAASVSGFYTFGKFEVGGGLAYVLTSNKFAPVFATGFRFQPQDGGVFGRIGFEYSYFSALQICMGYCF
ncbi:MAG TPA: hypothetical protein VEC36_12360 [Patescibacteria group bacterium]|nr:hypothetical protein [Patescibacteria group bacterium]